MKKWRAQIFRKKKKGREIQKQSTRQREEIQNRRRDFNQMTIFTSKVTLIIIPNKGKRFSG